MGILYLSQKPSFLGRVTILNKGIVSSCLHLERVCENKKERKEDDRRCSSVNAHPPSSSKRPFLSRESVAQGNTT